MLEARYFLFSELYFDAVFHQVYAAICRLCCSLTRHAIKSFTKKQFKSRPMLYYFRQLYGWNKVDNNETSPYVINECVIFILKQWLDFSY